MAAARVSAATVAAGLLGNTCVACLQMDAVT
eukprot:CAMPEP_0115541370 /NCGR_PEP_ID=MMETSP0271-20121206/90429_1 /TAXON_ID=71861 /ORGANISM="Scrippsiella trochoidea, Strain CCMP3099" /LENGTH=30 /DNA_ID= /DNA_START= /DNA_END= /DNA_ORIENTATION=